MNVLLIGIGAVAVAAMLVAVCCWWIGARASARWHEIDRREQQLQNREWN